MGMTNPILPWWLSRAYQIRWKPDKLPLLQNPSHRTDVFLSAPVSAATRHHEKSHLIHGPLGLHFKTQGYPVEYELDILILPLTIQLLHPCTTFSGDFHTSLLQQTGLSRSSNWIFAKMKTHRFNKKMVFSQCDFAGDFLNWNSEKMQVHKNMVSLQWVF